MGQGGSSDHYVLMKIISMEINAAKKLKILGKNQKVLLKYMKSQQKISDFFNK